MPLRTRMLTSSILALTSAVLAGLLTAGFMMEFSPLELWTYPVAALLAIVAIVCAWVARGAGVKLAKEGKSFPVWMSLLAFIIAVLTLFLTFFPSVAFLSTQFG